MKWDWALATPSEIELNGDDVANVRWEFSPNENTFASRGQKLIYWGPLKPLESILLRVADHSLGICRV